MPLDHYVPNVGSSWGDKREPATLAGFNLVPHVFCAGASLTKTPARKQEPRPPVTGRGQLFGPRPELPVVAERFGLQLGQAFKELPLPGYRQ